VKRAGKDQVEPCNTERMKKKKNCKKENRRVTTSASEGLIVRVVLARGENGKNANTDELSMWVRNKTPRAKSIPMLGGREQKSKPEGIVRKRKEHRNQRKRKNASSREKKVTVMRGKEKLGHASKRKRTQGSQEPS